MKKILKSILYGAIILAIAVGTTACSGNKKGEIIIDYKLHTVSIKEITYTDGFCNIELQTDKEVLKKFEESNSSPFWLGIINDKEYISAIGKTVLSDGLIFVVEAPAQPGKIVIFTTSDEGSFLEFDEATLQVTSTYTAEEITNIIRSIDPELCKKFDGYQPLNSSQNFAGISFDIISGNKRANTFGMITYDNIFIKSGKNQANEFTSCFYAVDADNHPKLLDVHLRGGHNYDNTEFFGVLMFDGNVDAKYALVVFEGSPPDSVPEELATPAFFYVVELGDKYTDNGETFTSIKSYCKTPYLAGNIFDDLER
jgi:hypothetical protein